MALSLFRDPFFSSLVDPSMMPRSQFKHEPLPTLGAVDVIETDKAHLFKADAPGLTAEDIKVDVSDDGVLTLSGERKREDEEHDEQHHYHRVERSYGSFQRSFRLPEDADLDNVAAEMNDGVLCVTVPKVSEPKSRSRAIKVGGRQK